MTKTALPTIEITGVVPVEAGETEYAGCFPDHPGWTFHARVLDDIDWDSDVCNVSYSRVRDYALMQDETLFLSDPGCYYDDQAPPLGPEHEAMIEAIDLHFGPSKEERKRRASEREATITRLEVQLTAFVEQNFRTEDALLVTDALYRVWSAFRSKS